MTYILTFLLGAALGWFVAELRVFLQSDESAKLEQREDR